MPLQGEDDIGVGPFTPELPESWSVSVVKIQSVSLSHHINFFFQYRSDLANFTMRNTKIAKAFKVGFSNILSMVKLLIVHNGSEIMTTVRNSKRPKI